MLFLNFLLRIFIITLICTTHLYRGLQVLIRQLLLPLPLLSIISPYPIQSNMQQVNLHHPIIIRQTRRNTPSTPRHAITSLYFIQYLLRLLSLSPLLLPPRSHPLPPLPPSQKPNRTQQISQVLRHAAVDCCEGELEGWRPAVVVVVGNVEGFKNCGD